MFKRTNKKTGLLLTGAGEVPYTLTRASGRKNMTIRIEENAKVSVTVPFYVRIDEVHRFLNEKSAWISKKLQEVGEHNAKVRQRRYADGHQFLFLGKKFPLKVTGSGTSQAQIAFDGFSWKVSVSEELSGDEVGEQIKACLLKWYRRQAEEILGARTFYFAREMGLALDKVTVHSQKRIWGSCHHSRKAIYLNWQIILCPRDVMDYVVVHELCHLKVPNHSKRFWAEVEKTLPDYRERERWFKANAADMALS